VAPVAHARRDLVRGLDDDDLEPAVEELHRHRQADRPGADHDDREVPRRRHQQQLFLLVLVLVLAVAAGFASQPQPAPPLAFASASRTQHAPESPGAGPPQQPAASSAVGSRVMSLVPVFFVSFVFVMLMESFEHGDGCRNWT